MSKKKPKMITIKGVKISIPNFSILVCTLLMTTSILVFSIILLSRSSANAEPGTTTGNNIVSSTQNSTTDGNKETEETVTVETGQPEEETTEEVETLEFDADEGGSSSGQSPLKVSVSSINTWEGKNNTIITQYRIKIKNRTKKTIENWGLSFHFEEDFTMFDNYNGLFEREEDNIKITPIFKNQVVEAGVEYELGFIIQTKGYIFPKAYTVVLDDFAKTVNLSFTIPEKPTEAPTTDEVSTEEISTEEFTTEGSETATDEQTTNGSETATDEQTTNDSETATDGETTTSGNESETTEPETTAVMNQEVTTTSGEELQ